MPCHNRAHDLGKTLKAYDRQNINEAFELIAVDDASSDTTYQVLTSYHPTNYTLRVKRMAENSGPAAARNLGIQIAKAPLILIVGDDILPDENLLWGHLIAHKQYQDSNIAVLGRITWPKDLPVNTLMTHIDGIGAQQFSYHYLQDQQEYDFRHFYTANVSLKKEILASVDHWFDTDFRYAAFEDAELAYRLSKRGMRIIYLAPLVGYHYHYHNIYTFSRRQRNAGFMANVLTSKHPRLGYLFRAQYLRIINLFSNLKSIYSPYSIDLIKQIEDFTLHLTSYYEWNPNKLLDRLYLTVLDHFYYKGVIEGMIGNSDLGARISSAHTTRYLLPGLRDFLREAEKINLPTPTGYHPAILEKLV
jgi:glycosyltransferase involved in cell wall biosynthesis